MKTKWIVVGLMFLTFLQMILPFRVSYWWDEAVYLQNALTTVGLRNNYSEFYVRPPVLSTIIGLGFLIHNSPITARIIIALFGAFGTLGMYLVGKKHLKTKGGLIAAALWATSPFIIENGRTIMTGMPSVVFLLFSYYFLLKEKDFLAGLFFGLGSLTRFTSLFFLALAFLIRIPKKKFKEFGKFLLGALIFWMPYLIWILHKYGLIQMALNVYWGGLYDPKPITYYFTLLPALFSLELIFALLGLKEKSTLQEHMLFWFFLYFIPIARVMHKESRYLLPLTIPIFLLSSKGILKLPKKSIILTIFVLWILNQTWIKPAVYCQNPADVDEIVGASLIKNLTNGTIYTDYRGSVWAYYTGLKTYWGQFTKNGFTYYNGTQNVKVSFDKFDKPCILIDYDIYPNTLPKEFKKVKHFDKDYPFTIYACFSSNTQS